MSQSNQDNRHSEEVKMSLFQHTQIASGLAEVFLRPPVILYNGLVAKPDLKVQEKVCNPEEYEKNNRENNDELKQAVFFNIG